MIHAGHVLAMDNTGHIVVLLLGEGWIHHLLVHKPRLPGSLLHVRMKLPHVLGLLVLLLIVQWHLMVFHEVVVGKIVIAKVSKVSGGHVLGHVIGILWALILHWKSRLWWHGVRILNF